MTLLNFSQQRQSLIYLLQMRQLKLYIRLIAIIMNSVINQLHQSAASHLITQISTSVGSSVNPLTINDEFRNFYASLYTSESIAEVAQFDNFFNSFNMPCIDPDISSNLIGPLTLDEINALSLMQNGKCPVPDGFPAEFFQDIF